MSKPTDWTAYYSNVPKYTSVARSISQNKIVNALKPYLRNEAISILELGGANSFIMDRLFQEFHIEHYKVIDSNPLGIELTKKHPNNKVEAVLGNALDIQDTSKKYDLVFSVGLIEHFDQMGTQNCIHAHFTNVKQGGYVLITFPTPTMLYKIIRGIAEILRIWKFHDERPLKFKEVESAVEDFGEVKYRSINWWIGLTQGYLLIQAD